MKADLYTDNCRELKSGIYPVLAFAVGQERY
jgi:hypothetical protein